MTREVTRCEASEEDRPAAHLIIQSGKGGSRRGNTHRRGRARGSDRLRWTLSNEMGHVLVHGSSM